MAEAAAALDDESFSSSVLPKNRLKFLCSYGGKILPRPSDGHLKFVGGDTRVLVVPRSISYSELKERIQAIFPSCEVIKYKLVAEDLDTLVSVTGDEDLFYMLHEYDRFEALHSPSSSSPRFRLFLYPTASAQRWRPYAISVPGSPCQTVLSISACSSAGISPTSTRIGDPAAILSHHPNVLTGGRGMCRIRSTPNLRGGGMHRVLSTPDLYGGGMPSHQHHHHQRHHHHHHQPENHHHLHRKLSPGVALCCLQYDSVGGAPQCEVCRCRVSCAPQPAEMGGLQCGGSNCSCLVGHAGESFSAQPPRSSSMFRVAPRAPVILEPLQLASCFLLS